MSRLRFKNFSDLEFIQGIDKPKCLQPLLSGFEDYFQRQGLDVFKLKNDDKTERQLLQVFTQPDEAMPSDLLENLYILDDLSDDSGHDRILDEATRSGASLSHIGDDMTPGEFAIMVYREFPDLVRVCHEKTLYRKIKNYQEYQSKAGKNLSLGSARKKQGQLEGKLALWFESRNRSAACEIYVYEEGNEIKFQITHGKPYRTEGTIERSLKRSRVAYRPQKHDSVIYNNQTHIIKISAHTPAEKDLYRKVFGEVLFGDLEYFPDGDIYTLEPLQKNELELKLVDGMESVRLSEVLVEIDNDQGFVQRSKAYNLVNSIEKHQKPNLGEGKMVYACFLIKYSSGGKARKLEVRPPNIAIYDRDRDGSVAEAFLQKNGLLKVKTE